MKKLKFIYYVIEKELQNSNYAGEEDAVEETTGNKNVSVYAVKDGEIELSFDLNLKTSENTHECIIDYLVDKGEMPAFMQYDAYYKDYTFMQL